MLALPAFHDLFTPPDPALRQPFTGAAFFPLYLSYYAMAVLVILPRTYIFRLSLLPFILWRAWRCAVGLNFATGLELFLGVKNEQVNLAYVISLVVMALRSTEWALARKPFRRYEPLTEAVERPLTISNVLLDAADLLYNQRGIRWSWGSTRPRSPPPSLAMLVLKILLKLTVYDAVIYIMKRTRPSFDSPAGDTLFDPRLDPLPRAALAVFLALCGAIVVYTTVDTTYHLATLVGRVLLRQPAADWPALSARPWMATSIADFWSFRWHQILRHIFVTFGARPGGALFGRPGALFGAFGVSALLHYAGMWGLGKGADFVSSGAFFVLMGVGALLERVWLQVTGTPVRGFWGWAWTMAWTASWGTFMFDGWARYGTLAGASSLPGPRLGKLIVDSIITLITNLGSIRLST